MSALCPPPSRRRGAPYVRTPPPSIVETLRGDRAAIAACAYLKLDADAQGAVKLTDLPGLKASRLLHEVEAHGVLGRVNIRHADIMLFSDGPNTRVEVRSLSDRQRQVFMDTIRSCAPQA
jgi:hypothetical protein